MLSLPIIPQIFVLLFISNLMVSCSSSQEEQNTYNITKAEIRQTADGYRILLNGEPFYIEGAGCQSGDKESLAVHGANSFKTWSTDNAKEYLDQAEALGLKVMMGISVGKERHGFNYYDEEAVEKQMNRIRKEVESLKDHPALIIWGIGNELNLEAEDTKVWEAVNDISKMIHEIDPNHLTTSPIAGISAEMVEILEAKAPDLDFISVQLYAAMDVLPELIEKSNYEGPIVITEWGATGYWEVGRTEWGAPIEDNSSVKADHYLRRYQNSILTQPQVMGSYVFLWGQKQERTPTWFGVFMPDGSETESVDVMHYVWNDEWPENRTPRLNSFTLEGQTPADNIRLKVGEEYSANVDVEDLDGDKLTYRWEIMEESKSQKSGGDSEYIPDTITGLFTEESGAATGFQAPDKPGAYRLYIYVSDGNNHTAHANIPFFVEE